jgi:hypothetical protein
MQETKRTIEADLICLKARPLANDSEADRMETERLLRSAIGAARRRETIVLSSASNWPIAAGRLCQWQKRSISKSTSQISRLLVSQVTGA